MDKKFILLLGASADQRFIIRTAKNMGLGTVVVDANPNSVCFAEADIAGVISTRDAGAIIRYARDLIAKGVRLAGVCVMGSDIPHIVSAVADHFHWSGPSGTTAALATDKFAMKEKLQQDGVPVPPYALVDDYRQIKARWKEWRCEKVVVKPLDQAGSRGVWCIDRPERAKAALEHAFSNTGLRQAIVEEFVHGPQISTETVLTENRSCTPGLVDRLYDDTRCFLPQIIENGGWYPSRQRDELKKDVIRLVETAARSLGISRGVAKGDVVLCPRRGPMLIEMAARLSGGDFSESLIPLGCGVNYVEAVLEIALGREPDWNRLQPRFHKVVANRYFFGPAGYLDEVDGLEEVRQWPGVKKIELFVKTGARLEAIASHGQRTGVFIVCTDALQEADDLINKVYRRVRFRINGEWRYGIPCL